MSTPRNPSSHQTLPSLLTEIKPWWTGLLHVLQPQPLTPVTLDKLIDLGSLVNSCLLALELTLDRLLIHDKVPGTPEHCHSFGQAGITPVTKAEILGVLGMNGDYCRSTVALERCAIPGRSLACATLQVGVVDQPLGTLIRVRL